MEYDPATVLLGAVVFLLIAVLAGVGYIAVRDRHEPVEDEWVQDLERLDDRLAALAQRTARLDAEAHRLEELAALHAEVARFRLESERLEEERTTLLALLAHITESLRQEIRRLSGSQG